MRIDDVNSTAQAKAAEPLERTGEAPKKERTPPYTSDHVEISQLADAVNSQDAGRLEQLRLQVEAGTYQVHPEAVAKAIVDEHLKP